MRFAIITHAPHLIKNQEVYAYVPYVREMNIWLKYVDEVKIVAPISVATITKVDMRYEHHRMKVLGVSSISLLSFIEIIRTFFIFPIIAIKIFSVMKQADHIHLRCPGNIGLIGCLMQVLFPKKPKTAKYAGNWDPKAKQPLSYRFQKWLLANTFWTKNMKVLVYGEWPQQSINVKSFFTATYRKTKIERGITKSFEPPYKFIFVGSLSPGKRPLYAIQLVVELLKKDIVCRIDIFGEGVQRVEMETYIEENELSSQVRLHGNQTSQSVEEAFKESHFLILPSQSEGWPKVVAEAMFWGSIPVVTPISCVPWMLDNGNRGILLDMNLQIDTDRLIAVLKDMNRLNELSKAAKKWSQQYTLDDFESEIKKLL